MYYIGFDPGKDKCGLALRQERAGATGVILLRSVVASSQAIDQIRQWLETYPPQAVILGDRTTSKQWQAKLRQAFPDGPPIVTVNERNSTLEARDRYWVYHPPRGLARLIPLGMRTPPVPVDDLVAEILIERYLGRSSQPPP
mgnify:CR=1 FL=1